MFEFKVFADGITINSGVVFDDKENGKVVFTNPVMGEDVFPIRESGIKNKSNFVAAFAKRVYRMADITPTSVRVKNHKEVDIIQETTPEVVEMFIFKDKKFPVNSEVIINGVAMDINEFGWEKVTFPKGFKYSKNEAFNEILGKMNIPYSWVQNTDMLENMTKFRKNVSRNKLIKFMTVTDNGIVMGSATSKKPVENKHKRVIEIEEFLMALTRHNM